MSQRGNWDLRHEPGLPAGRAADGESKGGGGLPEKKYGDDLARATLRDVTELHTERLLLVSGETPISFRSRP